MIKNKIDYFYLYFFPFTTKKQELGVCKHFQWETGFQLNIQPLVSKMSAENFCITIHMYIYTQMKNNIATHSDEHMLKFTQEWIER